MKKFFPIFLTLALILTLAITGCGGGNSGGGNPGGTTYTPGQSSTYTVGGVPFNMRYAPSGSFTSDDNTISNDPSATLPGPVNVTNAYWIAETEVTYRLWYAVYTWATDPTATDSATHPGHGQYTFANTGAQGSKGNNYTPPTNPDAPSTDDNSEQPVTYVSWRDAMVWCNALTEYYNDQNKTSLACVYTDGINIIRDSRDANATVCDHVTAVSTAKGFRLPTSDEWQLAARYKDGSTWTPGTYASGATAPYTDTNATEAVAWYAPSGFTHPVGRLNANALNLRDMSGNVFEWCFNWYPDGSSSFRVVRGGSWYTDGDTIPLGKVARGYPYTVADTIGFRPVRTQ